MPYKYWNEMTTFDFKELDPKKTIVILSVGSTEQHGPHLPLSTDAHIVEGVLKEILGHVPNSYTVLALPVMPIGKANEHMDFEGTLSLSVNTLIGLWTDIAESVFKAGLKKLMILNAHGGQTAVTQIVARDLRVRHDALVVPVNWWSVRDKPTEFSEEEYIYGIHGGAEETSVMMHLHPDLVRNELSANFVPNSFLQREKFPRLFANGAAHAWKSADLHKQGACGDATAATAALGADILKSAVSSLVELLSEMAEFELPV